MRRKTFVLFLPVIVFFTGNIFASGIEEKTFFTARQAFSDRFYKAAITLFDRFIKEFPAGKKVYQAKLFMAKSYYFKENYPEAIIVLDEIILNKEAEQSVINEAYYWLGEVYFRQKRFNDSLVYVQKAIDNYSDYEDKWPACYLAAVNYLELDQSEPASSWFRKIIQESGETELVDKSYSCLLDYYYHKKKYHEIISLGEKYLENHLDPIVSAKIYFYLGESRYADREFDAAIVNYQRALKFNQEDSFADLIYQGLSFALLEKEDTDAALSSIEKIKDPPSRLFSQGRYYFRMKKYPQALETFNDFLEKFKNSKYFETVYLNKADTLYELGRFNDAVSLYQQIISRSKEISSAGSLDQAHYGLAWCYLKKGEFREAGAEFENIKDKFPSSSLIPQTQYYLAASYFSSGRYKETKMLLEDFMEKFSLDKLSAKVYYLYGKCFFAEKEYPRALEIFKKAAADFKDKDIEELVYVDMGNTYFNLSLLPEAAAVWENFLSKFPHSQYGGSIVLSLGGLYEKQANYKKAGDFYKKIITDFKSSPDAGQALVCLGRLSWRGGNLDDALRYFEEAAWLNVSLSFEAKLSIARIHVQRSEYKQALELYDELAYGDSSAGKEAVLDKAFLFKDMKDYNRAVVFFRKAVSAGIDSSKIRFTMAFCLEKINQPKEAVQEYFKIIDGFDDEYKIKAYFRVARLYEKEGDLESARDIYRKIAAFDVQETKIAAARLRELDN